MPEVLIFVASFSAIVLGITYGTLALFVKIFPVLASYSAGIYIVGIASSLLFIVGLILSHFSPLPWTSLAYQYGAVWFGFLISLATFCFIALFTALIFRFTYSGWWHVELFLAVLIVLNIYGFYATFHPRITEYEVSLKGEHTWHGKTMVMVADMHFGNIYKEKQAKKLVETINQINPDIVLIPGDFFDGVKVDFKSITSIFKEIKAPYGTVFSDGNHEEYRNTSEIHQAITNAGIQILNNKKITLDGVDFAGVTFQSTRNNATLQNTLDSLSLVQGRPTILLKHEPMLQDLDKKYPLDLIVSGHTHRGQMFPFSLIPRLIYGKYVYGKNEANGITAITTSGVGTWGPPQRIGTSAEIVVIHIR